MLPPNHGKRRKWSIENRESQILAIFYFLFSPLAVPSAQASLPTTLGWYQIPNTSYLPLCPANQAGNCVNVIGAWSSGAADTKRNRLLFMGGGHSDYSGNEVYALDLNSLQMLRLNNPDPVNGNCVDVDPSGDPNSRHTYGGLTYVPTTDQLYMHGGALYPCGSGAVSTWLFDMPSLHWSHVDPVNGTPVTATCCNYQNFGDYDPVTDLVWYTDDYDFWTYNPHTNTQTHLSVPQYGIGNHINCVVDYDARLFTCFGDGQAYQADMMASPPMLNDITSLVSGCSALVSTIGSGYPGLAYDPVQKLIVGWTGGSNVTTFNTKTKSCSTVAFTGGPGNFVGQAILGHWRYFPSLGVFALVNDPNNNAWTLRMTPVGSPPPPPPPSSSLCDVNGDGVVNVADVQIEVNMALTIIPCTNPSGTCTVVSVQRVVNAALGGTCVNP